ncbi:MAG: ABC transporter permease [Candidatus Methanofastidiosia archaeon]
MAISEITLWELKQIFIGKKFTYAFIIQFFVILAIIPLFDVYGEILENPTDIILPTSKGYLPVAVSDSPLYDTLREHSVFRIYAVSESRGQTLLHTHVVCCFIHGNTITFDPDNPKARVAEYHLQKILQTEPDIPVSFNLNEKAVVPLQRLRARELALREIRRTAELMQSRQMNFSTLLILLLAIFLASGILVDLVVSEREKNTGEILMSLPVAPWKVLLSKAGAVVVVLGLQIVLWVATLYFLGRVSSLGSMIPLFLTAFLIISLTCLASVYSKSYKEAGFAITVGYVLLFAFLMSASAFYTVSERFSFLSPLSLVLIIEEGGYYTTGLVVAGLPTFLVSCLFIFVSVKMYERDEFYFGPRPSLLGIFGMVSLKTLAVGGLLLLLTILSVLASMSSPVSVMGQLLQVIL